MAHRAHIAECTLQQFAHTHMDVMSDPEHTYTVCDRYIIWYPSSLLLLPITSSQAIYKVYAVVVCVCVEREPEIEKDRWSFFVNGHFLLAHNAILTCRNHQIPWFLVCTAKIRWLQVARSWKDICWKCSLRNLSSINIIFNDTCTGRISGVAKFLGFISLGYQIFLGNPTR